MRSKVRREAQRDAKRLLKVDFRSEFAVEPVGIARRLGVEVCETKLDEEILGALFMGPGGALEIVLNRRHSLLRRRLTCALELGHYVHMSATTNEYKRADLYGDFEEIGGQADDVYAREFAACLLMPEDDVKILGDLGMDDLEMSLRFYVPRDAMQERLNDLGLRASVREAA
jgi:Zn-dependent peptidase ImmA (M78 family)